MFGVLGPCKLRPQLHLTGVSKMHEQKSGVSSPHQNKEAILYQYMSPNSFRGKAPKLALLPSCIFLFLETLKTPSVFCTNCT